MNPYRMPIYNVFLRMYSLISAACECVSPYTAVKVMVILRIRMRIYTVCMCVDIDINVIVSV